MFSFVLSHIDQLARFVDSQNIVAAVSDDPDDPNAAGLQTNFRQLQIWAASTEPAVEIHRLPIPPARWIIAIVSAVLFLTRLT